MRRSADSRGSLGQSFRIASRSCCITRGPSRGSLVTCTLRAAEDPPHRPPRVLPIGYGVCLAKHVPEAGRRGSSSVPILRTCLPRDILLTCGSTDRSFLLGHAGTGA